MDVFCRGLPDPSKDLSKKDLVCCTIRPLCLSCLIHVLVVETLSSLSLSIPPFSFRSQGLAPRGKGCLEKGFVG